MTNCDAKLVDGKTGWVYSCERDSTHQGSHVLDNSYLYTKWLSPSGNRTVVEEFVRRD